MAWYESLMFYGHRKDEQLNASDPDIKLIPTLIEKVLLPKLTGIHILSLSCKSFVPLFPRAKKGATGTSTDCLTIWYFCG